MKYPTEFLARRQADFDTSISDLNSKNCADNLSNRLPMGTSGLPMVNQLYIGR